MDCWPGVCVIVMETSDHGGVWVDHFCEAKPGGAAGGGGMCIENVCDVCHICVCVRVSHVHAWERFVSMCAYLCVQAGMVTCSWGMFIIYLVVGVSAHIFPFCLLTVTPQGLGSLVWVSCVLERRALMYVWNWGWCVEVFVLEVQSGLGGGPGVYIFAGSV